MARPKPAPEHIDYSVVSGDPGDLSDECIHDGDNPHKHRAKKEDHGLRD